MMVYVVLLFVDIYIFGIETQKKLRKLGWLFGVPDSELTIFRGPFVLFSGATGWGIHPTGIRWGRLFHAHGPVGLQRLRLSSDVLDLLFEDVASDVATLLATGFQSCVDHPQRLGSQTNPSVLRGTFPPWLLRRIHSCPLIFWNLLPQTSISSISSISSSQVTRAPLLGGLLPHPPGGPRCGLAQRPQRRLRRDAAGAAAPGGLRGGAAAEEPKAVGGLGGAVSCRRVGWWYGKLSDTIVKYIYIYIIYIYIYIYIYIAIFKYDTIVISLTFISGFNAINYQEHQVLSHKIVFTWFNMWMWDISPTS